MELYKLQDVFSISTYIDPIGMRKSSKDNFLEIVFIEKGKGNYKIKGKTYSYKAKDVFLIPATEKYRFLPVEETSFSVFRFTEFLFSNGMELSECLTWLRKIEYILQKSEVQYGKCIMNVKDRNLIWKFHKLIKREYQNKEEFHSDIVSAMVSISISIIVRNLNTKDKTEVANTVADDELMEGLMPYIQQNVYEPSLVKISALAKTFNTSKNAISHHFKKVTGDSLYHYVLMYRLEMSKERLKKTDFTVSQISHQLGFTDESHLTRMFKKYYTATPKEYRKRL